LGLFGKSNDEKIIDQVYVLISNASERLIQANGIKEYRAEMLSRAEWLDGDKLDQTTDALLKYAISLVSYSKVLLRHNSQTKSGPLINMAIQPKLEEEIVSSVFGDNSQSIIKQVWAYGDGDSREACPAEVLKWVILKK